MLTTVKLSQIIHDPKVQARVSINDGLVHDLTDAYERDDEIPPPVLFTEDNKSFYCADGHHRLCALTNLEVIEWPCEVRQGSKEEAFIFNVITNGGPRGLPMTRADKRKAARLAIDLWGATMSDRMIADKIKVSNVLISDVRKEMGLESPAQNKPKVNRKKGTVNINSPSPSPTIEPPTEEPEGEVFDIQSIFASAENQPIADKFVETVKKVMPPLDLANMKLNEFAESVRATRAVAREVFGVKGQEITAPFLGRFSWSGVVGVFNEILRMIEDYRPVGGTAEKPVVSRDQVAKDALSKNG